MTPDASTADYLDTVHQLLAEDQRYTDALEAAHRAGHVQVTDALASQRRVNDQVIALKERVRRLDGQVTSAVLRAGSADVTDQILAGMPPQPLHSVDEVARAVESVERDLVSLRSALDWLDRNPAAPRPVSAPPSPPSAAPAQAPAPPTVGSPAPTTTASPSGLPLKWALLVALIIVLAILGFLVL